MSNLKALNLKRYWPWIIWLIAALFYFYQNGAQILVSIAHDFIRNHFAITDFGLASISSTYLYLYLVMQIPVGIILDRYGAHITLPIAAACFALGLSLFAATAIFPIGLLGMALAGLGGSFGYVGSVYLASRWLPRARIPFAIGLTSMSSGIAITFFDLVLAKLGESYSWHFSFWAFAIAAFFLIPLLILFVQDKPFPEDLITHHRHKFTAHEIITLIKNKQLWIAGVYVGCLYTPIVIIVNIWRIHYLMLRFHVPETTAILFNAVGSMGYIVGAPLAGYLAGKYGRYRQIMLISSVLCFISILFGHYIIQTLEIKAIFFFFVGLFVGANVLTYPIAKSLASPHLEGFALGFNNMFSMLISAILVLIIGYLLKEWHSYYFDIVTPVMVTVLVAIVFSFFIKEPAKS